MGCVVDSGLGLPASDGLEEVGYSLDIHQDPNVVLVDLREWSLFAKSHLRTALHLSIADFKKVMHSTAETDILLSKSGLSDIITHYSVQEAPVLIVFYTQHGSWKDKDMVEAMASHRHRFSPGGARIRVGILQEGFASLSSKKALCVSTTEYREGPGRQLLNVDSHIVAVVEGSLYVADEDILEDGAQLDALNVRNLVHVYGCASKHDLSSPRKDGPGAGRSSGDRNVMSFLMREVDAVELLATDIPAVVGAIDALCNEEGATVIYCRTGRHRSVVAATAYLMHSRSLTFKDAYVSLYEKMPWLAIDLGYARALLELEYELYQTQDSSLPLRIFALFVLCYEDTLEALKFVRLPTVSTDGIQLPVTLQ